MGRPIPRRTPRAIFAAAFFLAVAAPGCAWTDDHPYALWHVVHGLCVPDQRALHLPLPCSKVDLAGGYAIVPDPGPALQYLIVPTRRIVGIEAPALLEPGSPNYWQAAWASRARLSRMIHAPLSRNAVGMAVNSAPGRSQDQLHIHVSCVGRGLAEALRRARGRLGSSWSTLEVQGRPWRVRTVAGDDLSGSDPFKLLAADTPADVDMAELTLVVAPTTLADGEPGFALLSRRADPSIGHDGHGEALLDETCLYARSADTSASDVR